METNGNKLQAEYRVRARRLLNQIRRSELEEFVEEAAARFRKLLSFSDKSVARIAQEATLKHALNVVAAEYGYGSWRELKESTEVACAPPRPFSSNEVFVNKTKTDPEDACFLAGWFGGDRGSRDMLLNRWDARTEERNKNMESL